MRYKKIMILTIILTFLVAVSAVSAAENATEDIISTDASEDVVSVEETTDDVVSVENDNQVITEGNDSEVGTFDELASEISVTPKGGVLNLTKDYKYVNGSTEGIQINKAITIDGQGHTIDGSHVSKIFNIYSGNVVLKNLIVINAKSKDETGGAIYWGGASGSLMNCDFINCSSSRSSGGAIHWVGDNGFLMDSLFENCSSRKYGGAVYFFSNYGNILNCSFINNSVINPIAGYSTGGALVCDRDGINLNNCSFYNNSVSGLYKDTIYWRGADGIINNTYFYPEYNSINDQDAIDLIFIKKDSYLYCENVSFTYNNPLNFVTLLNHNGKLVFKLINNECYRTFILNVSNEGTVIVSDELKDLTVGTWNVTVTFEGNDNYAPCNATATITVLPPSTSLTIEDVNTTVGHEIALVANVSSDLIIDEGIVIFYDGDSIIGESNVNNGVATLTYTPSIDGEHEITAIFNSGNYLSSNDTAKLLVDSASIEVLVDNGTVGFNSTFVAEVNGLYSVVNEGVVKFYVDNKLIGSVLVVNGSASINYIPLTAKTYTVKAVFCDSDKFLNDENSTSYTVLPADSHVAISDMNGTVGHDIVIIVDITSSNNLTINEGYVVFFDGSTQIGQSSVNNGVATLTYTPTTAGEHAITAMFYSSNYGDPINSALLNVSKASIDLSIGSIATVYFSNPSAFNVNVLSNSKGVNEGTIKYYVNGNYIGMSDVHNGKSTKSFTTNTTGSFNLLVVYNETDNYFAKNASTTFNVNKMPTTLTGESVIFDEEESKTFATELKNDNNDGVGGQIVKIEAIKYSGESRTFTGVSNSNGVTIYDVGDLAGGMWYVSGIYNGNDKYIGSRFLDKFIVIRMNTTTDIGDISNSYVNHSYKLKANIHDENGKLVKEGIVQFYLDGVDIGSIDLSKNQGHQSTLSKGVLGAVNPMFEYELGAEEVSDLYLNYIPTKAGKHTLTAVYGGTTIYKASNQTTTFMVHDGAAPTTLTSTNINTVYNGGKYLVATLKDIWGNPLKGVKVTVKFSNGKTVTPTTDKNGQVKVSTDGLVPVKTYTATITFAGNKNYAKSTKSVKVTVKKATPKLAASNKIFKRTVKVKPYTVTLKTNTNKVMKNTWVTLTINKKTFKAKTNAKGQAIFKITNLNKKGNFIATVKYAGNTYYNSKLVKQWILVR